MYNDDRIVSGEFVVDRPVGVTMGARLTVHARRQICMGCSPLGTAQVSALRNSEAPSPRRFRCNGKFDRGQWNCPLYGGSTYRGSTVIVFYTSLALTPLHAYTKLVQELTVNL